jgi:hypothetical protein
MLNTQLGVTSDTQNGALVAADGQIIVQQTGPDRFSARCGDATADGLTVAQVVSTIAGWIV